MEKGSIGKLNTDTIPVKTEERKPLFTKSGKRASDSTNRMVEELKKINDSLIKIMQSQQRMEVKRE